MTRRWPAAVSLLVLLAGLLLLHGGVRAQARLAADLLRGHYDVRCGAPLPDPERVAVPFDGQKLAAWLHTPPRAGGRAIVVHGTSPLAHRDATARLLIRVLLELDHDVLALDLRGYGDSPAPMGPDTPRTFDFGRDVTAAVRWWNGLLPGAGPPLLVGHSLGAGAVLRADAAGTHARGVIAAGAPFHEAVFASEPEIIARRARTQLGNMGLPLTPARLRALGEALRAIDPWRLQGRTPRLLLYGTGETAAARTRRYADGHPGDRVLLVEGVGHALGARVLGPCDLYRARSLSQVRRALEEWLRDLP